MKVWRFLCNFRIIIMDTFLKIIAWIIEIVAFCRIVLSPWIVGTFIGLIVFGSFQNDSGLIIGCILSLTGLVIGVLWATRVWKKYGATHFMGRIHASPDIDEAIRKKD